MAVRLNPCFGCPLRDGCALRAGWRDKISGLGFRSAWFVCPRLAAEIRPGRRIVITQPVAEWHSSHYDGDYYDVERIQVTATITFADQKNHTFASVVDPGQITEDHLFSEQASINDVRFRKKQAHRRIVRFLDEPDMNLCPNGNVIRDGKCDIKSPDTCNHFDDFRGAP